VAQDSRNMQVSDGKLVMVGGGVGKTGTIGAICPKNATNFFQA
jgi:hypothetical protein